MDVKHVPDTLGLLVSWKGTLGVLVATVFILRYRFNSSVSMACFNPRTAD